MNRSKAVARLRKTREGQAPLRSDEMATWQSARRQEAMAKRMALVEDNRARRVQRAAAASGIQSKLNELAKTREHLRLDMDKERNAHLVELIVAVNEMTAEFQTAGSVRRRASQDMSADVMAFLNERCAKRGALKARQAADFQAFRVNLAQAAMQARCEDFH